MKVHLVEHAYVLGSGLKVGQAYVDLWNDMESNQIRALIIGSLMGGSQNPNMFPTNNKNASEPTKHSQPRGRGTLARHPG